MIAPSTTALSGARPDRRGRRTPADAPTRRSRRCPTIGWMPGITWRDVAHVGAARRQRRLDVHRHRRAAQPHHLARGRRRPATRVGGQLVVGRLGLGAPRSRSRCRDRTRQEAVRPSAALEFAQRLRRRCARIVYCISARPGMMLVAWPPSVTMPCIIWPGASCWRSSPIATCETVIRVGGVDTEVRRDGGVRLSAAVADRDLRQRQRAGAPRCPADPDAASRVAAMSSNVPALSSRRFSAAGLLGRRPEQPPRSAPSSSATSASASAVPTADAAMMLWPQACPMPGSASYSAQIPIDQRATAVVGPERGVQAAGCLRDLEAAVGDQRLRLRAAAVFGEREFGFGVDRVRQLDAGRHGVGVTASSTQVDAVAVGILRSISLRRSSPVFDG